MPVSLDAMMREIRPPKRAEIEQDAAALVDACRLRGDQAEAGPPATGAGTRVRTGQRCPASGVWRVESSPAATLPIAIDKLMPPHRGQPVVWELVEPIAA